MNAGGLELLENGGFTEVPIGHEPNSCCLFAKISFGRGFPWFSVAWIPR
jgi:hypothetical protein